MGFSLFPVLFFSALWAAVGFVLPMFVAKGPNHGIVRVILLLAAFTCWLFWLCCYMAQMNPLIGPILNRETVILMGYEWSSKNPFKA